MTALVSLTTLKAASGDFADPSAPSPKDIQYTAALNAASMLVRNYTGLKFEVSPSGVASTRYFEYDGSGYLDIDECQTITGTTVQAGYSGSQVFPMTTDEWAAYPLNLPVKLWLRLPEGPWGRGISPEMGFTWNLDTLGPRSVQRPSIIGVTAVWGWPEIPYDVQQAAIWTALSINESPKPYTQESIENYSRTRGAGSDSEAIPERAQVALLPYIIPQV